MLAAVSAAAPQPPTAGADLAKAIAAAGLDPSDCYRVRDLSLIQADVRLYFNEGYLIFSKPVNGERTSAVFSAEVEGGDGETLLLPPYRSERQSLARFTHSPNMDEHFRAAVMVFTTAQAQALHERVNQATVRKSPEMGALLSEEWSPVLSNVVSSFELRLVEDLLTPPADRPGLLFAAIVGRKLGNFDVLYDARAREQILAGQLSERNEHPAYDIWANFADRGTRNGTEKPPEPQFTASRYRIEAALDGNLHLTATVRVTIKISTDAARALPFGISRAVNVNSARIDGAPAELLMRESERGRAVRDDENDPFLVLPSAALPAGSTHEVEFEEDGAVIAPAGNDVYFVGSRANWYPQGARGSTTFDLTFKYPKRLTLVTPGDITEDRTEGDWRITRRTTAVPIRMAGFNLGDYREAEGSSPGFRVKVFGDRGLESALQPKPQPIVVPPPAPRGRGAVPMRLPSPPLPPDPAARLRAVAEDVSGALQFYSGLFGGPPGLKTLTVSPIPANFGQGFPGLIYLSTLAYLDPQARPGTRGPNEQVFYSDLLEAHEVAHQWWGGMVVPDGYQDEWLSESLASYSSLLYLEKKKGRKAMEDVLQDYRDNLARKNIDGRTLDSAGPVTWGYRLQSDPEPDAWRAITYDKGAWIFHMLRGRMGDAAFFRMLAELRRQFESRPVSTADVRALAKEFSPKTVRPSSIDAFFDNWVYGTGIPALKLNYSVKGLRLNGTVEQSGVDDDFSIEAPVEIQYARGASQTIWVSTTTGSTSFTGVLRQAPVRVSIPVGTELLAR